MASLSSLLQALRVHGPECQAPAGPQCSPAPPWAVSALSLLSDGNRTLKMKSASPAKLQLPGLVRGGSWWGLAALHSPAVLQTCCASPTCPWGPPSPGGGQCPQCSGLSTLCRGVSALSPQCHGPAVACTVPTLPASPLTHQRQPSPTGT